MCWLNVGIFNAGPTLKQHKGNVTYLLGGGGDAHGANRSVTIQPDEGVADLIKLYTYA